ncbi:molybdopterin-dependent oxidoreductase [Mycobacterium sp. ITM-2016-00317]|uniref:molybdopterin-dependent oxidoreductase n=1 Tax=Mycobacterium sp. ITM-2016-00317 TaxID=2099694 RepID=UPI00287FBF8A|nr:molybdopterin-dependent oxidoreductase [Mycobacterium sp. ITM-2016-00317]WNG85731.1 molybdopterin-dependent oxidoreductase [Mycobacterium sp. ITM-2016-00317]
MAVEQRITYCRICEALCGLVATVEDGRLQSLRPDPDNPMSRGRACPKGIAFTDIQNDPDRVLTPLRRRPDGTFEAVGWDAALDDIADRLGRIVAAHGGGAVGQYFGNPIAFGYASGIWSGMFLTRLGGHHQYSSGSQDINSRFVASKLLYGAASQIPFPDLARTDFLFMLGANPLVSHGSAVRTPRVRDDLAGITARGGRVVVVDPRRTETARAYEHLPVRPDSDAWLLLSMLHVIFDEDLADIAALDAQTADWSTLRELSRAFPPERTHVRTGVEPDVLRTLARDFATAPTAVAYGRTGACLGRHGTLVSHLLDVLSIVTGNLDRAGGMLFARAVIPLEDLAEKAGKMTYDTARSRVGNLPEVISTYPAALMAEEIITPGDGQLRALFVTAGNPVLTVPNGPMLEKALDELDLMVSLDLYVNETNTHADYILPATTFLERHDVPYSLANCSTTVFAQASEAVVPAYGQARNEWEVFDELARRMGLSLFANGALERFNGVLSWLDRRGLGRMTPRRLVGLLMRIGPYGDRFGLRRNGINPRKLQENPHGIVLSEHAPTGIRAEAVKHPDGLVRLAPAEILVEVERLGERHPDDPAFPLMAIGMREIRSQNSWMHNSPTLMKGDRRHRARVNPVDAAAAGLTNGATVRVTSRDGAIETEVFVTDEVAPGTVAIPHGWGHRGGWQLANRAGGANVNELMSNDAADLERLAGMSVLNGVAVRIEPVTATAG